MGDILSTVLLPVFTFLFGSFLTRWWDRARPLIVLEGFSEAVGGGQEADCSPELEQLTHESWHCEEVSAGKVFVVTLQDIRDVASAFESAYDEALERLPVLGARLDTATNDSEIRAVLKDLLTETGINEGIEVALIRQEIQIDMPPAPAAEPRIHVEETEENDGSYLFVWKTSATYFGSELASKPFKRVRLEPFVRCAQHLEKEVLGNLVERLRPLIERQAKIHRRINQIVTPMVQQNTQWSARLLLANWGAAPMVLWPTAQLRVRDKGTRFRQAVGCSVALQHEESPQVRRLDGLHVLAPGQKLTIWVNTDQVQSGIQHGDIMRTHFQGKTAEGAVELKVTRRGALLGAHVRSNSCPFYSTLQLPD